jgi:type III restriction enzyme
VEGYTQGVQNKVTVDWQAIAPLTLDPSKIPPEVQVKASLSNNEGRQSISGPGKLERLDLNPYRKNNRLQTLIFELAKDLTKTYCQMETCEAPPHVLFPQLQKICHQYLHTKIKVIKPCELADAWLSPYYGWIIDNLSTAIYPDTKAGEAPEIPRYETHRDNGSTDDVDFWTSKAVYPVEKSHLNAIVADTHQWEQATAYYIDTHPITDSFVKNERLNFAIPYTYNDEDHEYIPDFIIRLKSSKTRYVIFETKGYRREGTEEKKAATERWCRAVNADGRFGYWEYKLCKELEVIEALNEIQQTIRAC